MEDVKPRIGILGDVSLWRDGSLQPLQSRQRRILLGLLAGTDGAVSEDRLIAAVWGDQPPSSALSSLRAQISRLRQELDAVDEVDVAVTQRPGGYVLDAAPATIDGECFIELTTRAGEAEGVDAVRILDQSLALWRDEALGDLATNVELVGLATHLNRLRLETEERTAELRLELGTYEAVASWAELHTERHPFRETAWRLLATARYHLGSSAEALDTLARMRQIHRDELGLDPSPAIADLELAILQHNVGPRRANDQRPAAQATNEDVLRIAEVFPREWRQLDQWVDGSGRDGGVCVISGPPGSGASQLLSAFGDHLGTTGWTVRRARGQRGVDNRDLAPWREVVASGVAEWPDDPTDAVTSILGALTQPQQPTCLMIDDIDLADDASVRMLADLASRLAGSNVVVMATMADPSRIGPLADTHTIARVEVAPIDDDRLGRVVASRATEPIPIALLDQVVPRCAGNFEVATHFGDALAAGTPPDEITLSGAIRRVWPTQSPTGEISTLACLLAVSSEPLSLGILTATEELERTRLVDVIDEGIAAGIFVDAGTKIALASPLMAETISQDVSKGRLARLHASLAKAYLTSGAHLEHPLTYATHLVHGLPVTDPNAAFDAAVAALNRAWDGPDSATLARSARLLATTLDYATFQVEERIGHTISVGRSLKAAGADSDAQRYLELAAQAAGNADLPWLSLEAMVAARGFTTATPAPDVAVEDLRPLVNALVPSSPDQRRLHFNARCVLTAADDAGLEATEALIVEAKEVGDEELYLWAVHSTSIARYRMIDPAERLTITGVLDQARVSHPEARGLAVLHRYEATLAMGDFDEAARLLDELDAEAVATGRPLLRWFAAAARASRMLAAGRLDHANELGDRAWSLGYESHRVAAGTHRLMIDHVSHYLRGVPWHAIGVEQQLQELGTVALLDRPLASLVRVTQALDRARHGSRSEAAELQSVAEDLQPFLERPTACLAIEACYFGHTPDVVETLLDKLGAGPNYPVILGGTLILGAFESFLGLAKLTQGHLDEAADLLRTARRLELDASLLVSAARTSMWLADALRELGHTDEADELADQAASNVEIDLRNSVRSPR